VARLCASTRPVSRHGPSGETSASRRGSMALRAAPPWGRTIPPLVDSPRVPSPVSPVARRAERPGGRDRSRWPAAPRDPCRPPDPDARDRHVPARGQHHRPRVHVRSLDRRPRAGRNRALHVIDAGLDVHEVVIGDAVTQDAWRSPRPRSPAAHLGPRPWSASRRTGPPAHRRRLGPAGRRHVDGAVCRGRGAHRRLPYPRPLGEGMQVPVRFIAP